MNNKLNKLKLIANSSVILIDGDERAIKFKNLVNKNEKYKDKLKVLQISEADSSFREIESLFSDNDKNKYNEMISEKSSNLSSLFKNNILKTELDEKTINNFYEILEYLEVLI